MKNHRNVLALLALAGMCIAAPMGAQGAGKAEKEDSGAEVSAQEPACEEIRCLVEMIQALRAEVDALKADRSQHVASLAATPSDVEAAAAAAAEQKRASEAEVAARVNEDALQPQPAAHGGSDSPPVQSMVDIERRVADLEHPRSLRYKGIQFTPGGYLAAEMLWRQHAENADIDSSYSGIPYPSSSVYYLTEYRATARQSRLSLMATGAVGSVGLKGYYEMDFQGAAPTANENQSNSYNLRQRQLYGEAAYKKWMFTGGQTWTLLTTNRKSIATGAEWNPAQIDAQYVVGYAFVRQMGIRVTRRLGDDRETLAFSVENPATLGVVVPTVGGVTPGPPVINGGPGTVFLGNGRNYSTNLAPDFLGKVAFDPAFGHFELKGVGRFFRDRVIGGSNNVAFGGGGGVAAIVPLLGGRVKLIGEMMVGSGIARYADSGIVDVSLQPNGNIATLGQLYGMAGIETQVTPKLMWYVYGGQEYQDRDSTGSGGYGDPSVNLGNATNCSGPDQNPNLQCMAQTKSLVQGMMGFWYTLHTGGYGAVKYGMQYTYTYKTAWRDATDVAPKTSNSMAFTSVRYYLP